MPALSEGGDVYRIVLSEKKRALSQLIFISLNDKSVSYLLQWGTMADFSRLLRKYLRWSDKPPLRRTCPACVPSHHLPVYSSSWYWFIQVVLCLLFLFSSVRTGSQVFEERMDDVNAPREIEELKIILEWRDAFRSLVSIVATPKYQDLVGHEL